MEGARRKAFTTETAICQSLSIIFTNLQNSTEKQILLPNLLRTCPILWALAELRREVISDLRRGAHIGLLRGNEILTRGACSAV